MKLSSRALTHSLFIQAMTVQRTIEKMAYFGLNRKYNMNKTYKYEITMVSFVSLCSWIYGLRAHKVKSKVAVRPWIRVIKSFSYMCLFNSTVLRLKAKKNKKDFAKICWLRRKYYNQSLNILRDDSFVYDFWLEDRGFFLFAWREDKQDLTEVKFRLLKLFSWLIF